MEIITRIDPSTVLRMLGAGGIVAVAVAVVLLADGPVLLVVPARLVGPHFFDRPGRHRRPSGRPQTRSRCSAESVGCADSPNDLEGGEDGPH